MEEVLRCIVIDDEPLALQIIADNIQKINFLKIKGTFTNPFDAGQLIKEGEVDLIFLDVQMPGLTGMQFLRSLSSPPMVIITTAHEHYAREGFDLSVVDYLVKPMPFERFVKAVTKAHELFMLKKKEEKSVTTGERSCFFIHCEYKEVKIYHDEILFIEGMKDYVKLYLKKSPGRPLLVRLNLKAIESKLIDQEFCRVHQSFIVSLAQITSFQKNKLFINEKEIPIGSHYAETFQRKYRVG